MAAAKTRSPITLIGVIADQPAASALYTGWRYVATDEDNTLYVCDGSTWLQTSTGSTGGSGPIDAADVDFTPAGGIAATDVQAAIQELDSEKQAKDTTLDTYAGIDPSSNVQSVLSAADYAAIRTLLGLVIGTNVQAYDADLTTYAGITPSANVQSLLGAANYAAMRTLLTLVVGTDVQAFDQDLSDIAALGVTNDSFIQGKGGAWSKRTVAQVLTDLAAAGTTFQPLDSDLTAVAGISPSNDDIIQRKSGAWTNRTMAQLIADLAALGTTFQPLDADLTAIAALATATFGRSLLQGSDATDVLSVLNRWQGGGSDFNIANTGYVDIASQVLTGLAAGDQLTMEVDFLILNNSTATRVYTYAMDLGGFLVEIPGATMANSSTNRAYHTARFSLDIRSTSLVYAGGYVTRQTPSAANTAAANVLAQDLSAWNTSSSNLTGTQTFKFKVKSANNTSTQTLNLLGWQIVKS